ncbi:MAG TPA: hypothetical protein VLT36_18105 [Candidatus Dormibacteraeota bacterium]|nr:hypothetical protein [Candidatus Dormibacteraeota bacterium]
MNVRTEPYLQQVKRWPASGRHILAQFANLVTPREEVYPIGKPEIIEIIGIDRE